MKRRMFQTFFSMSKTCLLFCLCAQALLSYGQAVLQYEDRTYSSSVRTVLLNPGNGAIQDALLPAILPLGSPVPLQLSFDILAMLPKIYRSGLFTATQTGRPQT